MAESISGGHRLVLTGLGGEVAHLFGQLPMIEHISRYCARALTSRLHTSVRIGAVAAGHRNWALCTSALYMHPPAPSIAVA